MNKLKIAKGVSTLVNAPIICIPLFLMICLALSYSNGELNLYKFITLEIVSLIFTAILPLAIILYWAKKLKTDHDISNRQDRYIPLVVGIISYFIGFLISVFLKLDYFLCVLLLCYSINTGVVLLITTKWKISVHTTGLSGPVAALILLIGPFGAILGVIYPILIWSRVILKRHTLLQALIGGIQGFFLTVIEMYLFISLFNLPVYMTGLSDSILYIFAIILTPIFLTVAYYVKKSKLIFILLEAIFLIVFLTFLPFNFFIIFLIVSITSILVSYFSGEGFEWNMLFR